MTRVVRASPSSELRRTEIPTPTRSDPCDQGNHNNLQMGHAVRAVNRMVHERLLLLHFSQEIRHAVPPAFSNSIRKDSSFCFLRHAHKAVKTRTRALRSSHAVHPLVF